MPVITGKEAMERRARQVLEGGEYIGMFEWLVWAYFSKARVLMLFGGSIMDVYTFFGSGLPKKNAESTHR